MKRLWITLLVVAMAAIVTLPAVAAAPDFCDKHPDHHSCPTTTEPPPASTTTTIPTAVDCQFDNDGVLQNWWNEDQGPYRCRWTTSASGPFTFHLTASSVDDYGRVLRPHMFVTDAYPLGDRCFAALENGWHPLPYTWESFTLPETGECVDSFPEPDPDGSTVFSLVIAARVKGTTPVVSFTQQ